MSRYTGPKHRIVRREGENIFGKVSKSLDRRINIPPGFQGRKGKRKLSEFGIQLREKQKLKRTYGILEKQFRNYVMRAQKRKKNTTEALIHLLETRLDNVVYRLGFAKSRFQARQFVTHRHILVNGKKVNVPSYQVKVGDVVTISPKLAQNQEIKEFMNEQSPLTFLEKKDAQGKLVKLPEAEEIANPVDYQLVIEFYSR